MKVSDTNLFRTYYQLTKPGIIYGNLITAASGFFLASRNHFYPLLLAETLVGIALIIAAACTINNYFDRNIDSLMDRTKKRALAAGIIPAKHAMFYAGFLGVLGFAILVIFTNKLTVAAGILGFVDYVLFYAITKRRTVHGTLIGSISGATPPLAGYLAVSDHLDTAAILLFLILVFWQMPHFYSIAIYRLKDYKSAGIPVLPAKKGIFATKVQILIYIVAFIAVCFGLSAFGYTGYIYLIGVAVLGLLWFKKGVDGFGNVDDKSWARKMFYFSLIVTLGTSILISIGALMP